MINGTISFCVCIEYLSRKTFLLWREGGGNPDNFVGNPNGKGLLSATSESELRNRAKDLKIILSDRKASVLHIDALMKSLSGLREGRSCSTTTCRRILDAWNGLEDLAHSLHLDSVVLKGKAEARLDKVYQKLFWGNNLEAITPMAEQYTPYFDADERSVMRDYLHQLWKEIVSVNSSPVFWSKYRKL